MKRDRVTIEADGERHRLEFSVRDLGLLHGPFFDSGPLFVKTLGVYDHFTVAGGIPKGSRVSRYRSILLSVAKQLLGSIQRDEDLLSFDTNTVSQKTAIQSTVVD